MAFTHTIAHHVQRVGGAGGAAFTERDSELPLDGKAEELLRELKRTYCNRTGKSYGRFSEDIGNFPFSSLLKSYCDEKFSFVSFSRKAMQHFKVELERGDAVVDAHLLLTCCYAKKHWPTWITFTCLWLITTKPYISMAICRLKALTCGCRKTPPYG